MVMGSLSLAGCLQCSEVCPKTSRGKCRPGLIDLTASNRVTVAQGCPAEQLLDSTWCYASEPRSRGSWASRKEIRSDAHPYHRCFLIMPNPFVTEPESPAGGDRCDPYCSISPATTAAPPSRESRTSSRKLRTNYPWLYFPKHTEAALLQALLQ